MKIRYVDKHFIGERPRTAPDWGYYGDDQRIAT